MTRFAIAPTDLDFFYWLRSGPSVSSVNFWTPTPWGITGRKAGDRLYFMLKAPIRKIGGYGVFVSYSEMTASDAWSAFGLGNGVDSKQALVEKLARFAKKRAGQRSENPNIGCIVLRDCVALEDDAFLAPEDYGLSFPKEVVKLKYFDTPDAMGAQIGALRLTTPFVLVTGTSKRALSSRKERKGQARFRSDLLVGYGGRCCISGEQLEELLEASHIQPYIDERSNHMQNGLCLRVDLHRLFDAGLITVDEQNAVCVSSRIANTSYAALHGRTVQLPPSIDDCPAAVALEFHRTSVFR